MGVRVCVRVSVRVCVGRVCMCACVHVCVCLRGHVWEGCAVCAWACMCVSACEKRVGGGGTVHPPVPLDMCAQYVIVGCEPHMQKGK